MNFNHYQSLRQATQALEERGFEQEFIFNGQSLLNRDTDETYTAAELAIVEYHRFADTSDPEDRSMIFAVETDDDARGIVMLNYSTDEDLRLIRFLDKIKIKSTPEDN